VEAATAHYRKRRDEWGENGLTPRPPLIRHHHKSALNFLNGYVAYVEETCTRTIIRPPFEPELSTVIRRVIILFHSYSIDKRTKYVRITSMISVTCRALYACLWNVSETR
jgi:hypothetical protein